MASKRKQNGPGPTITRCFRVTSSVKEPCTNTDDVESETDLPHTYRIVYTAFNLTMYKNRKIKNLYKFVGMYVYVYNNRKNVEFSRGVKFYCQC